METSRLAAEHDDERTMLFEEYPITVKADLDRQLLRGAARLKAILEDMREDPEKNAKRETQILSVIEATMGMVGDLQAAAGKAIPEISSLDSRCWKHRRKPSGKPDDRGLNLSSAPSLAYRGHCEHVPRRPVRICAAEGQIESGQAPSLPYQLKDPHSLIQLMNGVRREVLPLG